MPHYAHVRVEHGSTLYPPGAVVPDDLPGLDDLIAYGSVSTEPFTRKVVVDAQNRVIDPNSARVEAFAGDFTADDIDDPDTDTPSLGPPDSDEQIQHATQHDEGSVDG